MGLFACLYVWLFNRLAVFAQPAQDAWRNGLHGIVA
jgi:hypothetical protein